MTVAVAAVAASASLIDEQNLIVVRTRRRVLLLTLALVVAAAVALSYRVNTLFESQLAPEVLLKSETVAEFLASDVELAVGYGIPLDKLVGVPKYFDEKRAGHPEIRFVALLGPEGRPLYTAGDYAADEQREKTEEAARRLITGAGATTGGDDTHEFYVVMRPVRVGTSTAAVVAIGTDPEFVHRQLQQLAYDVGIILLVSLFLAFEIAVALLSISAIRPMNLLLGVMHAAARGEFHRRIVYRANNDIGRAIGQFNDIVKGLNDQYGRLASKVATTASADLRSRVAAIGQRFGLATTGTVPTRAPASAVDVRLPLFVFILAEELQKSFLPLYVRSLEGDLAWVSPQILIGLPISIYMATLALATPFAGSWAERFGSRRIFLLGLVPALVGFIGCAFVATVVQLIGARVLTAIGYAMCTIAAQGFIIQVTPAKQRAQGMSTFVGVLMSASICGTAIGGILADRVGFRPVFVCAASFAIISGVLAMRMLSPVEGAAEGSRFRSPRLSDLWLMLANWRFVSLVLFAAIPAKIALTGFLFYAVPLYLSSLGTSEAEIGRVMMVYSLLIVFLAPWLSRVSDRNGYGRWMVFGGALFSGAAMAIPWLRPDTIGIVLAVIVVSLAHAASITPQIALLPDICKQEIERIGETAVLAILRMMERVGSIIGPLLVAALVTRFGSVDGLMLVGVVLTVASPLLLTAFFGLSRRKGSRP